MSADHYAKSNQRNVDTLIKTGHRGRPPKNITSSEKKKQALADEIIMRLQYDAGLSKEEAIRLRKTLEGTLDNYEFQKDDSEKTVYELNMDILEKFLASKRVEGKSQSTLYAYGNEVQKLISFHNKPIQEVTADDIRQFMNYRNVHDKLSPTSIANIRMFLRSFFKYLFIEGYINSNPMEKIAKVKSPKRVVQTLSDEEAEMIRCACNSERDLAIVDILAGSGMRVSELCRLNKEDVDFDTGEMKVYGKGSKERICYLTGRAKVHLRWYLDQRTDNNPALFVTTKKPYARMTKNGVEYCLKQIAERSGIPKLRLYPHKYRSTLATNMFNRGADPSKIQAVLGHQSLETTISSYTNIANETVKAAHHQYVL